MKSSKYRKFRASRYIHRTHTIKGSGNAKGKNVVGTESAISEIQSKIGRPLKIHHIEKNAGQWIFCELQQKVS